MTEHNLGAGPRIPQTLGEALREAAHLDAAHPGGPRAGVRFLDSREQPTFCSWSEVLRRAERVAAGLTALGVRPNERVALMLPTSIDFFDAWFGTILVGAVPTALYPPVRLGRLDEWVARSAQMIRTADAVALLVDHRVKRLVGRVVSAAPLARGLHEVCDLHHSGPVPDFTPPPDALAMVQFSSGTTVEPKAVALSHRAVLANARAVLDAIFLTTPPGGDPPPAGVSWLPLYHDMGLIGCVLPALLAPGPLTLLPPELFLARPAAWLRAIGTYRGTISPAPNFAYDLCAERITDEDLQGLDLSTWRMALNGAEPISAATLRRFTERFAPVGFREDAFMPVYGLSEASLAVSFSAPATPWRSSRLDPDALAEGRVMPSLGEDAQEIVQCGAALPGMSIRITTPEGAPLPPGQIGHVQVRGPSLLCGYLTPGRTPNLPSLRSPLVDGWLDTGDLGALHDGGLIITGRAKDLIILRGRNHAPQDLEHAVDDVEGVRVGCAAAVADLTEAGERVVVFIEQRHEGRPPSAEACQRAILTSTGVDPHLVVILDPGTLPRTSSGKIQRGEALRRWKSGTLLPPQSVTPLRLAGQLASSALHLLRERVRPKG